MEESYRLLLVGKYEIFRECLAATLGERDQYVLAGQTETLSEAAEICRRSPPDLLLADLPSPNDEELEILGALREDLPQVRVLLLGLGEDRDAILRCVRSGINGFITKNSSLEELGRTIDLVLDGQTVCSPRIAYSVFTELAALGDRHRRSDRLEALKLTHREIEILQLIAEGLSNRDIAERLCLSIHTVKNHVHHILRKLEVRHRGEAVAKAYRNRWLHDRRHAPEGRALRTGEGR